MPAAPNAFHALTATHVSPRAIHWLVLALLIASATLFRLGLVERMAPHRPEPDAYYALQLDVLTGRVPTGATARGKAEQLFGAYPTFVVRPLAAVLGERLYATADLGAPLEAHLRAASRPLVGVRAWCALLCVFGVVGVFFLARELLDPGPALVACGLVAFSLLHLVYSHQARPHAPHMAFEVWALCATVRYAKSPSILRLLFAAVALWAAFASLQTGVFLWPPFLMGVAFAAGSRWIKVSALCAAAAAYALAQPFHVGGLEFSREGVSMASGGHAVELSELNGGGVGPTWRTLRDNEPVAGVLAALGLLLLVHRGRDLAQVRSWCVLAAYGAPYVAFALLNEATRDRYLIPLLPLMAVCAAFAVERAARRIAPHADVTRGLLAAAALALPACDAVRYWRTASRPDTLEQAAAWLAAQPDAHRARIATSPYLVLPLAATPEALQSVPRRTADESGWIRYQRASPGPLSGAVRYDVRPFIPGRDGRDGEQESLRARLNDLSPTWVVLEPSNRQRSLPWHVAFEALVRANGERVARFDPDDEDPARTELFEYGDVVGLRARLWGARCMGPPIEVYRWKPR